jgi:hypothetical protein
MGLSFGNLVIPQSGYTLTPRKSVKPLSRSMTMTEEEGLKAVVGRFLEKSFGKKPEGLDEAERMVAEIMIAAVTFGWKTRGLWYSDMLTKERDLIERKEI